MGSFFDKLFGRFVGSRKRTVNSRKLRVESLERRQLMASDLGAISGTVYTDLTDNGLTGDDALLSNVTVRLYRDGGNATFDNGGSDDTLVGTTTTNVSGVYRFNDLIAGTYYVQQAAATGVIQRTAETVKTITITPTQAAGTAGTTIDAFTTSQTLTANSIGSPVTDVQAAAEAIGGQRELFANLTAGASIDLISNAATAGILEFNTSPTGAGTRIITYDGTGESDATVVDGTGLGGIDLTNGGNDIAFRFTAGADQNGGNLLVRVYSSATDFSQATVPIDNTGGAATATLIARFANFTTAGGAGADFTNVNAIQIEFSVAASDGQLDLIETVGRSVTTSNAANLNPMTLGNSVFRDVNNNGTLDVGETGIASVTVEVYADTNANGSYDAGTDTLVDTATTNASGAWTVTDLFPGDYIGVIPASQFLAAAPLFGMVSSTGNPDPDNDVDNDDNGVLVGAVVATSAITLVAGGEPTTDGDTDTNSNLTLDFGFTPNIDLTVVKSGTATIDAGGNVTYTITVTNNSPIAATNVQVSDNLPTGVTFVPNGTNGSTSSASWTQQVDPNAELLATITSLAAGANQVFTVVVTTDPALVAGTLNNVVTVTSDGVEQTPADNTDDADTVITRNAVLQVTKSDGTRTTVSPGDTFAYTLEVTNTGLSTANNVTLIDTLPAGYTFVSFGGASEGSPVRTVVGGLDQISAGVTSLTVGEAMTVIVNVSVASTIAGTTIVNTVTADSDDSTPVTASDTNNIVRNVDLAITKTAVTSTVGVGGKATYTLAVTNNGPLDVTGVEVDDDLPVGLTLATTGNPGSIASNVTVNRDFIWTVGNLANGQTATVSVIVDVASTFTPATGVTNTATIAVARLTGFTDTNSANDTATAQVAVEPRFDLLITKDDGVTTVAAGQQYSYTITVNNAGPSAASNVVISDTLPTGLQFVSATSNSTSIGSATGQAYSATIASLASGETRTITLTVLALASITGTSIANTATVTADNASTQETGTRANSATDTDTLTRTVTYNVTKTGPTTAVLAGANFTYTVIAFNSGTADAPSVVFSDPLPAGVTFVNGTFTVNGTSTTGTVTLNTTTNQLEANLGTLLAGGSSSSKQATITINVTAGASTSGTLTNTAKISGPDNTTGVTSTATTTVNPSFDLTVTKSDGVTTVQVGQNLVYTIVVTNSGPSTATNVLVTDTFPTTQLTLVSATSSSGTFTNNNGSVSGTIASLATGATATITITGTVKNDVPNSTVISNSVAVSAANETTTTNNSAADTTTVTTLKTISGFAYIDSNRNGTKDTGEVGIAGVLIFLTGTANGQAVSKQTTTDANGLYTFADLQPGTYNVSQTQPTGFTDGSETAGTTGGTASTTQGTDTINGVPLSAADSTGNNFGETRVFSKRLFMSSTTANTQ